MNASRTLQKLVCTLLLALAIPASAAVSRDEAAEVASRDSGGRVLSVEKAEVAARPVWRVKVLTPRGDVRVVLVDAATGGIL